MRGREELGLGMVDSGVADLAIPTTKNGSLNLDTTVETDNTGGSGRRVRLISDIVEEVIHIDRRPFRYIDVLQTPEGPVVQDRSYLKPLYNVSKKYPDASRTVVMQWARQTEKSTTAAAKGIVLGSTLPGFRALYVQPRFSQVSVFSQQRFRVISEWSPTVAREMLSTKNLWQVGMKEYKNGSTFNFRSCYLSADATRGVTADYLNADEFQDLPSDEIAVIEETQAHARPYYFFRIYSGTPKTPMNALTRHFKQTCEWEWMVRCNHGHWSFLDHKVIGDKYFVCTTCGCEIFPKRCKNPDDPNDVGGQWEAMRPSKLSEAFGFRISQIQVPFQTFKKVKAKLHNPMVSFARFQNEVLGLESEAGEVPLTEQDIRNACDEKRKAWETPESIKRIASGPMFMGIDHGTGQSGMSGDVGDAASFTVVTIGTMGADGVFRIVYMEKYLGEKLYLTRQPGYFDETARKWKVVFAGSDWGYGFINNQHLIESYGWDVRTTERMNPVLLEMQSVRQKAMATFQIDAGLYGRYMIDRNQCMSMLIDEIKRKRVQFPSFEIMKSQPMEEIPFVDDFTSIFIEYDQSHGTMSYEHSLPDDAFQSCMLCRLAAKQYYGELVRTWTPNLV